MNVLTEALRSRISVAWGFLILATVTSWWLGTDHGVRNPKLVTTLVLLVAFVKVRLVAVYFMEVREAPLPLRLIIEGYCLVVCATLIAMYLAG